MTDVFENLATKGSGLRGSDWTEEQMQFGCVMAIGIAIVFILLVIGGVLMPDDTAPKDDSTDLLRMVAGVIGGGACLGVFVLLSLAFGYFVNRK